MTYNNQVTGNKKFETKFYLLDRHAPSQFDYMLPCYKD